MKLRFLISVAGVAIHNKNGQRCTNTQVNIKVMFHRSQSTIKMGKGALRGCRGDLETTRVAIHNKNGQRCTTQTEDNRFDDRSQSTIKMDKGALRLCPA